MTKLFYSRFGASTSALVSRSKNGKGLAPGKGPTRGTPVDCLSSGGNGSRGEAAAGLGTIDNTEARIWW